MNHLNMKNTIAEKQKSLDWNYDIAQKVLNRKKSQRRNITITALSIVVILSLLAVNYYGLFSIDTEDSSFVMDFEEWYYFRFIASLFVDTMPELL